MLNGVNTKKCSTHVMTSSYCIRTAKVKSSLILIFFRLFLFGLGGSVGCAFRLETRRSRVQHSFVEIDHEIFSTVILSLPLIQEGQLSVSGERMCTILVSRLEN